MTHGFKASIDTKNKKKGKQSPFVPSNDCSYEEASKILKEKAQGVEVLDVPAGEPLFLFSYAEGKTRPVTVFYDSGCSHVVFKHGVPGVELEGVKNKQGPLDLKAVGNTTLTVREEWTCLLSKTNGSKQIVQGVSMDRITTTFPMIDVSKAVAEVKQDDLNNQELQSLRIPQFVGGEPDVLLGTFYENCHPVKVHVLPSGLFIAKLQLASHDSHFDGVIGGPHESFRALADKAGGANNLMCHFIDRTAEVSRAGTSKVGKSYHVA